MQEAHGLELERLREELGRERELHREVWSCHRNLAKMTMRLRPITRHHSIFYIIFFENCGPLFSPSISLMVYARPQVSKLMHLKICRFGEGFSFASWLARAEG